MPPLSPIYAGQTSTSTSMWGVFIPPKVVVKDVARLTFIKKTNVIARVTIIRILCICFREEAEVPLTDDLRLLGAYIRVI